MSLRLGLPLFIISAVLQSTLLPRLRVFGGQPDLIVIIVLVWASLDRDREGLVWAFAGGLFLDLWSGTPLGLSSLILLPIAYAIGLTEAQVYRSNFALPFVLNSVGVLGYHLLYLIALRFLGDYPVAWSASFWYVTLPSVLFDIVLIAPALWVLGRLYDRLHPRQVKV